MHTIRCASSFGKARCERGWVWSPKLPLHDYDLWYAMDGKGEMRINEERYPIGKGSCFLIRPGDAVHAAQDDNQRLTVIFIHFTLDEVAGPELPGRHAKFEDTALPETCLQRMLDVQQRGEAAKEEEFELLMRLVLLHMRRQEEAVHAPISAMHKQLVHKVIDELAEHHGIAVTVAGLASAYGVSPRHLSHLFKTYTGYSLKTYMTRVRMERARFLLAETAMNITEVSHALGYADIYHFSKAFKQHCGAPPTRFRFKGRSAASHYGEPPS
ncbi:AraC family transcriptional regulator [Paenibacillus glycinis]|uniref:Helix-turn-helix domain-containing protein n=1 Tax=Paenibacillus glycinis TaxID=2697035 RepID=A0ABW9XYL1_9BACL|nr:AraC family transcriptional regulator [Paenibacillus glycinis]NBD27781.1 helix-turn-helix domain-containing protein [Paenibacillus glycinis]